MDQYMLRNLFDRLLFVGGGLHGQFKFVPKKKERVSTDHGRYSRQNLVLGNLETVTIMLWEG